MFKVDQVVRMKLSDEAFEAGQEIDLKIVAIRYLSREIQYYVTNHPELTAYDVDGEEMTGISLDFTYLKDQGIFNLFSGFDVEVEATA
jgi:hypothetical protein